MNWLLKAKARNRSVRCYDNTHRCKVKSPDDWKEDRVLYFLAGCFSQVMGFHSVIRCSTPSVAIIKCVRAGGMSVAVDTHVILGWLKPLTVRQ
jgi:hypothetical protein